MSVTSGQIAGVYDDGVLPVLLPIAVDSQGRLLVSGGGGGVEAERQLALLILRRV